MMISSRFFYLFFIGNGVLFLLLLIFAPSFYDSISREDQLIENLTAVALFAAGLFLVIKGVSIKDKAHVQKALLIIVGLVFFLGAGEEISWGQRIFGWETPEALSQINEQNETNFHNINKKFFDRLVDRVTIIFVLFSTFLILTKKTHFKGIPYPNVSLVLCFASVPFFHQYNELVPDFYLVLLLPIVVICIFGLRSDKRILWTSIITLFFIFAVFLVHFTFNENFPEHNNSANEFREYLFALCCVFYAIIIWRDKELT